MLAFDDAALARLCIGATRVRRSERRRWLRSIAARLDPFYPILASTALAAGTVAAIEAASFVSGFGSTAEFSVSKVAALHMDDTSPQDITAGSPSRSMFQIDAIALRTDLWASFGLRAVGHAQFLTGATW
jgi:hypothetical protein